MKPLKLMLLILAAVIVAHLLFTVPYTQDERERVVIYQWGVPLYERTDAGLHAKWPWPYQSTKVLEKRWVAYHASAHEVLTKDKKALMIDTVAYFRIQNGIRYIQTVQTEANAQARLDDVAYSEMRKSLGARDLDDIVVKDRSTLMLEITRATSKSLQDCCGLETPLVRVIRADFPEANKESVYQRMQAERARIAAGYESEGREAATKIRATTDKEVVTMVATATEQAQRNRGDGDQQAARIYNEAYSQDAKFFALWRGLQTAQKALAGTDIRFIQSGQEPHLKALFGDK
jgi:membrane protease subunit HflC